MASSSHEPWSKKNKRRAIAAATQVTSRLVSQATGVMVKNEYVTGSNGRARKRAVLYGVTGFKGGMSSNPGNILAYKIRGALKRPPTSSVILYNAEGQRIGTMDPLTRVRTLSGNVMTP